MSGIYIHIPFCKSKCSYCDFYSVANSAMRADFVNALIKEIELRKDELNGQKIKTIYFGGGTPSQLNINELERIFQKFYSGFNISDDCEISFEANPDDLSIEYLQNLKQTPVNRLSIGIQSIDDKILKMMRRRHNAAEGICAVEKSLKAGFENISIDLIYGIESLLGQQWENELKNVLQIPVTHLSAYHLGIEEGTLLYRKLKEGKIGKIDEKSSFRQYEILLETTQKYGFEQYEISNFAKDNKISKHNSAYWNRTEYLGLGPSAHSFTGNKRIINSPDVKKYINNCSAGLLQFETDILSVKDILNETIMLGLRTVKGINLMLFLKDFSAEEYNYLLTQTATLNPDYYKIADEHLCLTPAGMFVSDNIISTLFR
jgi:oxygen-independent coproporphyrinogen III oxidase